MRKPRRSSHHAREAARVKELTAKALGLREQGMTLQKVGQELGGYEKSTVHGWLKKAKK